MEQEAPTGVRRRGCRRWLRWFLCVILVLPLAALGLGNLILGSSWARGELASKIQARTTLETRIESLSWTPWGGVSVGGLTLEQPVPLKDKIHEPLVHISSAQFWPAWKPLLKGQIELRQITVDSPRIVLPIEMISYAASAEMSAIASHLPPERPTASPSRHDEPPAHSTLQSGNVQPPLTAEQSHSLEQSHPQPDTALTVAPPLEHAPASVLTNPSHGPSAAPSPQMSSSGISSSDTNPSPPPDHHIQTPPPSKRNHTATRNAKVLLKNASLSIVSAGLDITLLEGTGISGEIPVAGPPRSSKIQFGALHTLGNNLLNHQTFTLDWNQPIITIEPFDLYLGGLKNRLSCQVALLPEMPTALNITAEKQPLEPLPLPGQSTFTAPEISSNFVFRGNVFSPSSWQAYFAAVVDRPSVIKQDKVTKFDLAQIQFTLQNGTLSCRDARMIGDHISLLGNAMIQSDGKSAGVLRIVASPETTVSTVNQLFPALQAPPAFSAMSTPQRVALDIEATGSLGAMQIRLGKNGPLLGSPTPPQPITPP